MLLDLAWNRIQPQIPTGNDLLGPPPWILCSLALSADRRNPCSILFYQPYFVHCGLYLSASAFGWPCEARSAGYV
jgi:hypothetical protein